MPYRDLGFSRSSASVLASRSNRSSDGSFSANTANPGIGYCAKFRLKLQRDYFIFMCWMFSPFICTLRRQATLEGRYVLRFPWIGIVIGKSTRE